MMDGVNIIDRIAKRGAFIKVLDKPHLDLTTPMSRGFIALFSALAKDVRHRIVARANAGRKVARAKGVKFGSQRSASTSSRRRLAARKLSAASGPRK